MEPDITNVTFYCNFRGLFAHTRAKIAYNKMVEGTCGFTTSIERFSLRDPRTWFCSRVEACPDNDPKGFKHAERVLAETQGFNARFWHYTTPEYELGWST